MIVELGVVLTYLLCGVLVLRAAGVSGSRLAPLGFIAGSSLFALIGIGFGIAGSPLRPGWALGLTWLVSLAAWLRFARARPPLLRLGLLVLGAAAVVAFARTVHLVSWHSDSFQYLMASATMARGRFDELGVSALTSRMASFPFLHAPAHLQGELYVRSLSPLLAVSVSWLLGLIVYRGARNLGAEPAVAGEAGVSGGWSRARSAGLGVAAAALLLTNNRFVFNAFYVNGHLLFAANLLALSGCGWLRLETAEFPGRGLMVVQSLAALGMAWSRPEGTLVAGLALLPFFCSPRLSGAERALPVLTLGAASLAWHGYAASVRIHTGGQVASSVVGLLALSGVLCAAAPLVAWKRSERRLQPLLRHLPWITELGLWLLLLGFGWRDSTILNESLRATFDNFVLHEAAWGSQGVLLALLVCAVLGLLRIPGGRYLRFPVTTFLPLAFVAAYLRGTPFRAGNWDSLARMAIHVVPLAIALIALGALGRWRRWPPWAALGGWNQAREDTAIAEHPAKGV